MKTSLRKKLYTATQLQHAIVESTFDFESSITIEKLILFYQAIYLSRSEVKQALSYLSNNFQVPTYNDHLIHALRNDLTEMNAWPINVKLDSIFSETEQQDRSIQVGVFYVFAGSSMGARLLLATLEKENISVPVEYLNQLVVSASDQMKNLKHFLDHDLILLDDKQVIDSAQRTFTLIYQTARLLHQTSHNQYNP